MHLGQHTLLEAMGLQSPSSFGPGCCGCPHTHTPPASGDLSGSQAVPCWLLLEGANPPNMQFCFPPSDDADQHPWSVCSW